MDVPAELETKASNIFEHKEQYGAAKAFDGDPATRWATDSGTKQAWVSVDLGRPVKVRGVRIREEFPGRVRRFEFQQKQDGHWTTIFAGTQLGANFQRRFPSVRAREFRLNILEASEGPTISEIELTGWKR